MKTRTWTCRRQSKGKKCLHVNPSRKRLCGRCNKPKPKRKLAIWTKLPNAKVYSVNARGETVERRRQYIKSKRRFLKENPVCQCCFDAKSSELHHRNGRLAALLTLEKFWIALCSTCHRFVHDHPSWARARGLLCAQGQWNKQPT